MFKIAESIVSSVGDMYKAFKASAPSLAEAKIPAIASTAQPMKAGITSFNVGNQAVRLDSSIVPKVQAADASMFAATGQHIKFNSSFRSFEDQQRLWDQSQGGRLFRVARPGTSNHESGLAFDVGNWQQAQPFLAAQGFKNPMANDRVHFSLTGR